MCVLLIMWWSLKLQEKREESQMCCEASIGCYEIMYRPTAFTPTSFISCISSVFFFVVARIARAAPGEEKTPLPLPVFTRVYNPSVSTMDV